MLVGLGALGAIATIVFLLSRLGVTGGSTATVDTGSSVFNLGDATELAETVETGGPLLLPDASGGQRDVWVQHLSDEPTEGWRAFAVRPEGAVRDCFADWNADRELFVDTCDDTTYPPDGEGLKQYSVTVTADETVELNLGLN